MVSADASGMPAQGFHCQVTDILCMAGFRSNPNLPSACGRGDAARPGRGSIRRECFANWTLCANLTRINEVEPGMAWRRHVHQRKAQWNF